MCASPLAAELARYRHPLVRDLAWALLAPPLLALPEGHCRWFDAAWCASAYAGFRERLLGLEREPGPLLDYTGAARDKRLGVYFETLLAFWLETDPRYELLAHALPVREGGDTRGEFDFIVRERASGEVQHWEVALKFYLGLGEADVPADWVGPGLRDRLDRKLNHLLERQTRLAVSEPGRAALAERGLRVDSVRVLLKGRLFYPEGAAGLAQAEPGHERGWWLYPKAFRARFAEAGLSWRPLAREHWLAPLSEAGSGLALPGILAQLGDARFPLCVVGSRDGREETRGFIAPAGWPGRFGRTR